MPPNRVTHPYVLSHNAECLDDTEKQQFIGIPGGIYLGTTQSWIKSQLPTINYNCYKKQLSITVRKFLYHFD
jgi:hypothetical protein